MNFVLDELNVHLDSMIMKNVEPLFHFQFLFLQLFSYLYDRDQTMGAETFEPTSKLHHFVVKLKH